MIPLYIDEDSERHALVNGLRARNLDALTAGEAGNRHGSDEEQLASATSQGGALYTANVRHFPAIHDRWLSAGRHHAGLILLSKQDTSVGDQIRALVHLSDTLEPPDMQDRVEYLTDWIVRG